MKNLFTNREDERLTEMMEVVSWQLEKEKDESLGFDKMVSLFKEDNWSNMQVGSDELGMFIALEREIAKKDTNFSVTREARDDELPVWDYNEHYEEKIFWSELKERIIAKAAALSIDKYNYLDLTPEEKIIFQDKKEISYGALEVDNQDFILPESEL